MKPFQFLAPTAVVSMMLAANPAAAHARLVSATPAQNTTIAPTSSVRLTFSERSVPAFSTIELANGAGVDVPLRVSVSDDGRTLTGTAGRRLAVGTYTLTWGIASADGHRMTGSYSFTVR